MATTVGDSAATERSTPTRAWPTAADRSHPEMPHGSHLIPASNQPLRVSRRVRHSK
jgi:hypothetical protein